MTAVVLVALGAAVGAVLRHLTETAFGPDRWTRFPWPTFVVNVVGSFILGVATAASARGAISADMLLLIGAGGCGALTTYSGFAYRVVEESVAGRRALASTYVLTSVVVCVGAAALGYLVGS
jgi:fluoride exporter